MTRNVFRYPENRNSLEKTILGCGIQIVPLKEIAINKKINIINMNERKKKAKANLIQ